MVALKTSLYLYLCSFVLGISASAISNLRRMDNTIYLIRHGEKPPHNGLGLSSRGQERAQCIADVFGVFSEFNVGYILAQQPLSDGHRRRPADTVTPLAEGLGLAVDTHCDRDDHQCVVDAIAEFAMQSTANILVCWEHKALTGIMKSLGLTKVKVYPRNRFDLIYTVHRGKLITYDRSEECSGLDD